MGNLNDLAALDARGQAELVSGKDVKPIALVDSAIEGIERVNGAINAGLAAPGATTSGSDLIEGDM